MGRYKDYQLPCHLGAREEINSTSTASAPFLIFSSVGHTTPGGLMRLV